MSVIRTLALLVAAIGLLSFTGGCDSKPGAPATKDMPKEIDRHEGGKAGDGKEPEGTKHVE